MQSSGQLHTPDCSLPCEIFQQSPVWIDGTSLGCVRFPCFICLPVMILAFDLWSRLPPAPSWFLLAALRLITCSYCSCCRLLVRWRARAVIVPLARLERAICRCLNWLSVCQEFPSTVGVLSSALSLALKTATEMSFNYWHKWLFFNIYIYISSAFKLLSCEIFLFLLLNVRFPDAYPYTFPTEICHHLSLALFLACVIYHHTGHAACSIFPDTWLFLPSTPKNLI